MKKIIFSIAIVLLAFNTKAQTTFNEAIGGTATDQAIFARETTDGGFIVVGWTTSFGAGGWDIYLVKTNSAGAVLWTKTYGGPNEEIDCSVQQTTDKGFIITARTTSYGSGSADVYLIKTDSVGTAKWTKTFGGTDWEEGHAVQQTKEGGYIHTGYTKSFGAGNQDVYLIKNDNAGTVEWTKTFGGSGDERGHFIHQTQDKGYIIIGETTSFGAGGWDFYLIKTDSNGTALWTKTYGGAGDDFGWDVQATKDGGYIVGGWTGSFGAGGLDYYLIKTDNNGTIVWSHTYGGPMDDNGYAIQQTTDGGYIIAGETTSFGLSSIDSADVYLVKTDSLGNLVWSKTFGGTGDDGCQSVQQTSDGGYLLSGYTNSFGAGNWDFYLIKTDANGNSNGCEESNPTSITNTPITISATALTITGSGAVTNTPISQVSTGGILSLCSTTGVKENGLNNFELKVYPNPSSSDVTIRSSTELGAITIYNSLGELVLQKNSKNRQEQIDLNKQPSGLYIVHVHNQHIRLIKE